MERELELARQVQQSMLPHISRSCLATYFPRAMTPARQVGGDFYDMFVLDDDHFGIVMADVADKGMPAALYMALTRSLLLAEARRERSPRITLNNVNRLLLELGELNGLFQFLRGGECSTHRLAYTRAGHERPLLLRDGRVVSLAGEGAVLGILEGAIIGLSEEHIDLQPGDRLVLYTDGLTDVANQSGEFLGLPRFSELLQALAHLPGDDICSSLFSALSAFRGQAEQFDDMTVLILERQ